MANFKIKIESEHDGAGIKAAEKDLGSLKGEAEKLGKGGVLGSLSAGIGKVALAFGGIAVAVGAAKRAFREYAEAQKGVFQLDQALRAHGNLVDSVRGKYQAMAGALQETTAIADDEWIKTLARLTQFGVKPEQMDETIEFVKNLAGAMDGDLRSATEATIRALGGNYEAFSRLGIQVDESATRLEKWTAVAKLLAEIGGGQLEAGASGAAGGVKRLDNSLNDLWESMGKLIVVSGVLKVPIGALKGAANLLSGMLGGVIEKADGMNNVFHRSKLSADEAAEAVAGYTQRLKGFEEQTAKVTQTLNAEQKAEQLLKDLMDSQAQAALKRDVATVKAWEREKRISPERAGELTDSLERHAEGEQFQRDQKFKESQIRNLEKQITNENAAITRATLGVLERESALKDDKLVQAAFDQATALQRGVIDDLEKKKTAVQAFPFSTASVFEAAKIEEAIEKERATLAQLVADFTKGDPAANPLAQQLNVARNHLETVTKDRTANKTVLQEELGRSRLEKDSAQEVRRVDRQTGIIESSGSWAAGAGASRQILSGAARDSLSAFQKYSQESATHMREQQRAFEEALRQVQALRRDHEILKAQMKHHRNY